MLWVNLLLSKHWNQHDQAKIKLPPSQQNQNMNKLWTKMLDNIDSYDENWLQRSSTHVKYYNHDDQNKCTLPLLENNLIKFLE